MKKIKAKNYFPYPSQESFEDALNIIAEIRAENYFWTKKIWYVEQKIKKFANIYFMTNPLESWKEITIEYDLKEFLNPCG